MDAKNIVTSIVKNLKSNFVGFKSCYHFGSTKDGANLLQSDIDLLLLFDTLDSNTKEQIIDFVNRFEYDNGCFIDYKLIETKNIEAVNPFFLKEAVQKGVRYE